MGVYGGFLTHTGHGDQLKYWTMRGVPRDKLGIFILTLITLSLAPIGCICRHLTGQLRERRTNAVVE